MIRSIQTTARRAALGVLVLTAGACNPAPSPSPLLRDDSPALAITNVTVVDVAGGPSRPGQTVLVSGNRIASVGPASDARVSRGARVVDGTGKYLIPGMWDMHSHITMFGRTGLNLYLAQGVTASATWAASASRS